MSDEWISDCASVRAAFGYRLRKHVLYQSGADTEAPSLIFADADYEVGDGKCGLHEDGKSANEPAIVFVRADSYLSAIARIEALEAGIIAALRAPDEDRSDILRKALHGQPNIAQECHGSNSQAQAARNPDLPASGAKIERHRDRKGGAMGFSLIQGGGRESDRSQDLADALIDVIYERADGMTVIAIIGVLETVKYEILLQSEKGAE